MRVAGIRLDDGRAIWVDAGDRIVAVLDHALIRRGNDQLEGWVFITPEQLIRPVEAIDGVLVGALPSEPYAPDCTELPGADLPPLGTMLETGPFRGMVTALDPANRIVTLTLSDGASTQVAMDEIRGT